MCWFVCMRLLRAGFYIHVEASGLAPFSTLQMYSPTFNSASYKCTITLAYHMWGSGTGRLQVFSKPTAAGRYG